MIPYKPLSFDSIIGPPDGGNPPALIEASNMAQLQGVAPVVPEASHQQRTLPVDMTQQADYFALGLAGNLSTDQISAVQQALADALQADEQRAAQMQRVRSKEPQAPQAPTLPGNSMQQAAQPGMSPQVGTPMGGPSFIHGHN